MILHHFQLRAFDLGIVGRLCVKAHFPNLHPCREQWHVSVVKRLLRNKADVNTRDHRGRTPLSLALSYLAYINTLKPLDGGDEHEHEIRMLLATKKINIKPKDMALWTSRLTPYSLERDHLTVAKLLLDTGKIHNGIGDLWVQPPSEWLAIVGSEQGDLKTAQAASMVTREREAQAEGELQAAIAASIAKMEEESQERTELEAAINLSLLKTEDEAAILKAVMAISLVDTTKKTEEEGESQTQANDTDFNSFYYDNDIEFELAMAASLADNTNVGKPQQENEDFARANFHENSISQAEAQQQINPSLGSKSKLVQRSPGPKPSPKPKPERFRQPGIEKSSRPTPPSKPGHLLSKQNTCAVESCQP